MSIFPPADLVPSVSAKYIPEDVLLKLADGHDLPFNMYGCSSGVRFGSKAMCPALREPVLCSHDTEHQFVYLINEHVGKAWKCSHDTGHQFVYLINQHVGKAWTITPGIGIAQSTPKAEGCTVSKIMSAESIHLQLFETIIWTMITIIDLKRRTVSTLDSIHIIDDSWSY